MGTTSHSEDPKVLIDLLRRSPFLEELQDGPLDRRELQERLGISRATIHRHKRLLAERELIEKVDGRFALTETGVLLADAIDRFKEEAEAALHLAPLLDVVDESSADLDVDAFTGATVTIAEHGDPYAPVNRFESLLERTTAFRFVGSEVALMEPCLGVIQALIRDGVEVTFIDRPGCADYFLAEYPELSEEAMARENFTVLEHDDLPPYGIGLLSDRVVISCYEQASGTVRTLVDTDAADARAWAERTYGTFLEEARPVAPELLVE